MSIKDNKKFKIAIISILSILVISVAAFYLYKAVNLINCYGFKNVLMNHDKYAKFIYFMICFLQPIILPLPEPVTIMGGSSVFGPFMGASIGFLGTMLGILVMFFIAKFIGIRIVNKMIDEEKIEKFNKYIEKNDILIILMLFILPILPDEVICMGSGLAKINSYKFIIIATIAKLITSISLSYSLQFIKFDGKFIVVAVIVAAGALFLRKNKLQVQ